MNCKQFCDQCQYNFGTKASPPTVAAANRRGKKVLADYPRLDWSAFEGLIRWAKDRRITVPSAAWLIGQFEECAAAGYLPEFSAYKEDLNLEAQIRDALEIEEDKFWYRRLMWTEGAEERQKMFGEWLKHRLESG